MKTVSFSCASELLYDGVVAVVRLEGVAPHATKRFVKAIETIKEVLYCYEVTGSQVVVMVVNVVDLPDLHQLSCALRKYGKPYTLALNFKQLGQSVQDRLWAVEQVALWFAELGLHELTEFQG